LRVRRPGVVGGHPRHPPCLRRARRHRHPLQSWHGPRPEGVLARGDHRRGRRPRRGHDRRGQGRTDAGVAICRTVRWHRRGGGAGVAAHVLRLRVALLFGALRGGRAVRAVMGLLAAAAATVAVCLAILSLADGPAAVARTVIILGAAATMLGFLIGPILVGAVDQLDPRRFTVFGVNERQMPWILGLASLVSIPSFALIALGVCVVIVAVHLGTPWPLAVTMAFIGLLSTALAARIGMALNALVLPERRSRELTALFALAVLVIAFPVAVFFGSLEWNGRVPDTVAAVTTVLALTPLAAAPGASFTLAAGDSS